MPKLFQHTRFDSFLRALNLHGFSRRSTGNAIANGPATAPASPMEDGTSSGGEVNGGGSNSSICSGKSVGSGSGIGLDTNHQNRLVRVMVVSHPYFKRGDLASLKTISHKPYKRTGGRGLPALKIDTSRKHQLLHHQPHSLSAMDLFSGGGGPNSNSNSHDFSFLDPSPTTPRSAGGLGSAQTIGSDGLLSSNFVHGGAGMSMNSASNHWSDLRCSSAIPAKIMSAGYPLTAGSTASPVSPTASFVFPLTGTAITSADTANLTTSNGQQQPLATSSLSTSLSSTLSSHHPPQQPVYADLVKDMQLLKSIIATKIPSLERRVETLELCLRQRDAVLMQLLRNPYGQK